jgi:pyridoxal phosphate-dependent aminotransferase EpsN
MTHANRIYLSTPHMGGEELKFIHEAFDQNWISPVGPHITAFENEMCSITGAPFAVALTSGTAALHLSLMLSGVNRGDEVICSSFTFAASANAATYVGAVPVFIDSEERSWNLDPGLLRSAIKDRFAKGKRVAAVIAVHLYGQSADISSIRKVCDEFGIVFIEDAAESLGATYQGRMTGTYGRMGIYSFNGNKIITTSGGGMLVSAEKELIDKARFLSTQARDPAPHYEHTHIGYNYRMSNICAGIGRGQLKVLQQRVEQRRAIFDFYFRNLSVVPGIGFMPEAPFGRCNRWLTCITIDPSKAGVSREELRLALEKENIESRPLWKPMHLQPVFKDAPAYVNGVSEKLFRDGLCLPSGSNLSDEDLQRILKSILKVLKH